MNDNTKLLNAFFNLVALAEMSASSVRRGGAKVDLYSSGVLFEMAKIIHEYNPEKTEVCPMCGGKIKHE